MDPMEVARAVVATGWSRERVYWNARVYAQLLAFYEKHYHCTWREALWVHSLEEKLAKHPRESGPHQATLRTLSVWKARRPKPPPLVRKVRLKLHFTVTPPQRARRRHHWVRPPELPVARIAYAQLPPEDRPGPYDWKRPLDTT